MGTVGRETGGGTGLCALARLGAGRSARSLTPAGDADQLPTGGAAIDGGGLGTGGSAVAAGAGPGGGAIATRDLHSVHVTNFAPPGTLAPAT